MIKPKVEISIESSSKDREASMPSVVKFPARKFFGMMFGTIGGLFGIAFLVRSIITWEPVPDGVLGVLGILTGGFGAYVWSSSYEQTH